MVKVEIFVFFIFSGDRNIFVKFLTNFGVRDSFKNRDPLHTVTVFNTFIVFYIMQGRLSVGFVIH